MASTTTATKHHRSTTLSSKSPTTTTTTSETKSPSSTIHKINRINYRSMNNINTSIIRNRHRPYRRTTLTFVDVIIQRYGVDDVVGQFENCPFEVFVLGGISPRKSGK